MDNPFERIRTEKVFLMMPVQLLPAMEAIWMDQIKAKAILVDLRLTMETCSNQVELFKLTGYINRALVLIQNNEHMMEVLSAKLPQA